MKIFPWLPTRPDHSTKMRTPLLRLLSAILLGSFCVGADGEDVWFVWMVLGGTALALFFLAISEMIAIRWARQISPQKGAPSRVRERAIYDY